ncbi:MAG: O-antigen ligase family protein [Thermodesulfobacteriota bacterium]
MFLFTSSDRRRFFDWFCCACLAIIVPVELAFWLVKGYGPGVFQLFTFHPIPLGTVIILLSSGPVGLLVSKAYKTRMLGGLLLFLGGILIFYAHKRGTWLAVAAMLGLGLIFLVRRRKYLVISLILVFALLFSLQCRRFYARLDPKVPRYVSVLHRVELYNFARHIWETHPIMGIGLRPFTHARYLKDYQLYNQDLNDFSLIVEQLQTFDNMILTALVELGSLMTLLYLGLVIFIVVRYVRFLWSSPTAATTDWYRILVIGGLAFHSLTYDSLLSPPVNWLFHVQLGIMAAYPAAAKVLESEPVVAGLRPEVS